MTVFKTFLKVLKSCKGLIIMYTAILIFFGAFNMKNSDKQMNFVASKPDILIINKDKEEGITKDLIKYVKKNSNIIDAEDNKDAINDALFYRDVNYIIYIPENFRTNFLAKKNPKIEVKSTKDYQASLAQMIVSRYMKLANIYNQVIDNEDEMIEKINSTLKNTTDIKMTSSLNTSELSKVSFYYNFANYSILAGCVYVICLILSSFKDEKIKKRTVISSMDYKKYNRYLLLSNGLFAVILWLFYVILSFILIGNIMLSMHGLFYIINSFIFTVCAVTISFLIGNLVGNKNAINGIVNVVALGSSFLCGSFVPMEYLPDSVLKIAHILPSYYYIKTNNLLTSLEVFNFESLKPVFINMIVVIIFSIVFVILTNIISNKKRKIG